MKNLCLICLCVMSFFGRTQNYDMFYDDSLVANDTVYKITWEVADYIPNNLYCYTCKDPLTNAHEIGNMDSVNSVIQKVLKPHLGELASSRVTVREFDGYNTGEYVFRVSEEKVKSYLDKHSECKNLRFIYWCALRLNDSVYYSFKFKLDHNNKVLDPENLPLGVKKYESMDLVPASKVYKKALNDPYFNEGVDRSMDLKYSKGMHLFYYELKDLDGKLLYEDDMAYRISVKHIFIDAKTGKILWRTPVEHQHSSTGCVFNWGTIVPESPLTGPSNAPIMYFNEYSE